MTKVTNDSPAEVDIRGDQIEPYGDDDDNQYVYLAGDVDGNQRLVIGGLTIFLTPQQEEKLYEYFSNT